MRRNYLFLSLVMIALGTLMSNCESPNHKRMNSSATVTGKVGEILVVCEESIWKSEIKAQLDTGLTQWIMPYFPDVATFELVHRTPAQFTQGVKRFRNTLFLTIDADYKGKQGKILKRNGVWAKEQMVIDITAKNFDQLLETVQLGVDEVHDIYDKNEWERLIRQFAGNGNNKIKDSLRKNFGIDLVLPQNSQIVWRTKNFYRIEFPVAARPIEFVGSGVQDAGNVLSGIMVYQYDYNDSSQLAFDELLRSRDTMLKYNVPSEVEGMYMGTQYAKIVYPEGSLTNNKKGDLKGFEIRGMYVFTGRPRTGTGGAFWSFHFVHPKRRKLVCISGYVDAPPTTSWTHFLREIQAIWKSVELVQ